MSTPLVTIGISFKDPGPFFALALQSVFAQSFQDWELLLVDDGSTDGSGDFAAALSDRRVHLYRDGLSRNLNVRLNQMVRMARGKYFFRMDADDVMHPERVARQLEFLEQAPESTVVGSAAFSIDSANRVVGIRPASGKQRFGFAARHSFIHPTVAASRNWFLENPYSESLIYHRAQDAELWCRTSGNSRFHVMPEPLLFYRESDAFFLPNYLGTSMGTLYLAQQQSGNKYQLARFTTTEVAKIWLTSLMYGCGRITLLVNRRFQPIDQKLQQRTQALLDSVGTQPLPRYAGASAA